MRRSRHMLLAATFMLIGPALHLHGDSADGDLRAPDSALQRKNAKAGKGQLLMALYDTGARNVEIYLMTEDGKKIKNLTNNPASDYAPEWSPDAKRIVFSSNRSGNRAWNIFVMDADGKNVKQLTRNKLVFRNSGDHEPTWSPDGKRIAFRRRQRGIGDRVFAMNADGSGQVNLSKDHGADPDWSPDGKKIVFTAKRGGSYQVYLMDANGKNTKQLLSRRTSFTFPAWSPDGKKLAYTAFDSNARGRRNLYVYDFTDKNDKQLTKLPGLNSYAAWSPDGKKIAWISSGNSGTLYIINADGSNQRKILTGVGMRDFGGSQPSWKPK